jgi:hypothetical protein
VLRLVSRPPSSLELATDGAESLAAHHHYVPAARLDRQRRRRTSVSSETNTRLLNPATATQLADSAVERRQRAPDPWPAPLHQPSRLQRVIIGLGSGRCGTQSLAELLSAQPDCWGEHEMIVGSTMLEWEARKLAAHGCE